jgi:hypothetical protein
MPNLNDLLAETPAGIKKFAAIESPDRQQVEQDFGKLAFAFLRDRAPQLLEYLVGFEVVDQEPDGSKAVGIFGFNINGSFWYVPAFFMHNQIKGMDLLYSMDKSSFYPLRESWINYIMSKQSVELGTRADPAVREDLENPNFDFISSPPVGIKRACEQYREVWNKMQHDIVEAMDGDADFQEAVAGALSKIANAHLEVERKDSTPLIRFLKQAGGPDAVYTILNAFEDEAFLKAASTFYDYRDLMIENFSEALAPKEAQSKVRVVTTQEFRSDNVPVCCDTEDTGKVKKRVVRDGFALVDERPKDELSEVYNVDYMTNIGNPDDPGTYLVIMRGGAQVPMTILPKPFRAARPSNVVAIDPSSGRFFNAPAQCIFAQFTADDATDQSGAPGNLYDKAAALGDMNVGQVYILVDEKLNSSLPFRVEATVQEGDELVRIKIKWLDQTLRGYSEYDRPDWGTSNSNDSNDGFERWDDSYIMPVDRGGNLRKTSNNLVVPTQSFKAFKLNDDGDSDISAYRQEEPFAPASLSDINEMMQKAGAHRLRVDSSGAGEYTISLNGIVDEQQIGYKTASIKLVCSYGLTPDIAEEMLKEADDQYKSARLVKLAQVSMPMAPPPPTGYDPTTNQQLAPPYATEVEGQTYGTPPTGMNHGAGSGFNLGSQESRQLGQQLPTDVNALAQDAAATGQQQVFDHAMIGSLAGTYDVSAAIDSFLPEMLKALDRVGRILFLFYWKNEDFAERYGDQDMTEMEDHLRAVFKSYGDLVLKLRQKTIDAEEAEFIQV